MMGLELYIDVTIKETATGHIISFDPACSYNKSFHIFWFDGWAAAPVRRSWIEIINRYGGTHYTEEDNLIFFPQTALREMCSCSVIAVYRRKIAISWISKSASGTAQNVSNDTAHPTKRNNDIAI